MNTALLIVDVQNDFVEGGALGVDGGKAVAADIVSLLETSHRGFGPVVATRDWHLPLDDNGGHFADPSEDPDFAVTWPPHCIRGTSGAEYAARELENVDFHVVKGMGTPAYSGFEGRTRGGEFLGGLLRRKGVNRVLVCGIATDFCVRATVMEGLHLGFEVAVLDRLTAAVAQETERAAVAEMVAAGAVML